MLIFSDRNFLQFLVIKTLDLDLDLDLKPDLDPDPNGNLCGSETLDKRKKPAKVEQFAEDYSYVHQEQQEVRR